MKKIIAFTCFLVSSSAFSIEVSEETAIAKLEEFFYLLDVDRYEKDDFFKVTTKDFQIFEDGLDLDRETFHEFIKEATGSIVETDWTLSDFKVTLGIDSAHISYYNNGIFKTSDGESIYSFWMESVFLVVEEGELKVQFLQSDIVEREIK
ncbi:hypothetical protein OAK29_02275 [Gammaproteobacteria bacterium]|nr:hypothetical protein [Gammaproteobacteria bacterium]